ncbi:uncharacterized protein FFFS_15894 [Fusarium fujikuroi]|nr:uncharacterized protein FFFS_15894 [Fusarium fujikuroi]
MVSLTQPYHSQEDPLLAKSTQVQSHSTTRRRAIQKSEAEYGPFRPLSGLCYRHPKELLQYLNEHELAILEELKSCDISKTDNTVPRAIVYKSIETDEEEAGWNAEENDTMEETEDEITAKPEDDDRG